MGLFYWVNNFSRGGTGEESKQESLRSQELKNNIDTEDDNITSGEHIYRASVEKKKRKKSEKRFSRKWAR